MKRTRGLAVKGVSAGITLLMLTLSVAIPTLERSELANGPVAESEHDPGACPTGHDHTICTQVGANLAAPASGQERELAFALLPAGMPSWTPAIASGALSEGHPSRAPPLT